MKIFQKNKIKTCLFVSLIGLSSCNLLIQEPISDLISDNFWKSQADAEVGVAAIYSSMSSALSRGLWDWGELRGESFLPHEKEAYDQGELIYNNILNDNYATLWTQLYQVIGQANSALKYIPKITMSPSLKNNLLAEAHTLRAWAYFYAVRVWGDVPLFIDPLEEIGTDMYRPRTDKDYILENVILVDLEKAYLLINRTSVKRTRINIATICALQMDVNAWMHRYDMVVSIMNEKVNGLNTNDWNLMATTTANFRSDWRGMFIEDPILPVSREVLFKMAYEVFGNGVNNAVSYFASSQPKVWVSNYVKNNLYDATTDMRFGSTQWENVNAQHSKLNRKFWYNGVVFTGINGRDVDLVLYRYADIVLLYAEALAMTDNFSEAVYQLNRINTRAGNPAYFTSDFLSQEELIHAILLERHREFLGEGKRWFDLVRCDKLNLLEERNNVVIKPNQIYFPIHRDHINQNPLINQNPY